MCIYQKSDLTTTFSLKNISLDKIILFEDIKILRGAQAEQEPILKRTVTKRAGR